MDHAELVMPTRPSGTDSRNTSRQVDNTDPVVILASARKHGIRDKDRLKIGELLGTSAQAAQQRYGAVVEQV